MSRPADLRDLRNSLQSLLSFLSSDGGRTDANSWTTDALFSSVQEWARSWADLPEEFRKVLDDVGGVLHDTVYAPHIASNFDSLPEQLLQRVRSIP